MILPKLLEMPLELLVGVEEPGAHGPLGHSEDCADLGMGHPLNIKHSNHRSVIL